MSFSLFFWLAVVNKEILREKKQNESRGETLAWESCRGNVSNSIIPKFAGTHQWTAKTCLFSTHTCNKSWNHQRFSVFWKIHGEPQATLYLIGKLLQNFTTADRFVDRWPVYTTLWSPPSCFGTQALGSGERRKSSLVLLVCEYVINMSAFNSSIYHHDNLAKHRKYSLNTHSFSFIHMQRRVGVTVVKEFCLKMLMGVRSGWQRGEPRCG